MNRKTSRLSKVMTLIVIGFLLASLSACGNKKVEIDITDYALNLVEDVTPSKDYAFFVSSDSVPQFGAILSSYKLIACIGQGDKELAQTVQIATALEMKSTFSTKESTADCVTQANVADTLLVTQRKNNPPSGMVEIIFK